MAGPLTGIRVIEIGGIGPSPYCGMLLGDLGAEVIRIERASVAAGAPRRNNPHMRNRRSIALNLKSPRAIDLVLRLLDGADACTEGFRPGVAERLGFGPDTVLARNPRLVYGRMTGWGQTGPLSQVPGHDINYIALAGALHSIGRAGSPPSPPLNLLGDFAGGGLFLAFGLVAALLEAGRSGKGQVVDAAMLDGVASLMSAYSYYREIGLHSDEAPGTGPFGGAAHFYGCYETKDGKFVSIGALEPEFYQEFLDKLEFDPAAFASAAFAPRPANDPRWGELREQVQAKFRTRTRAEWCELLEGSGACFAPVLPHSEAPFHPHAMARGVYVDVDGSLQAAPTPKFSGTPAAVPQPLRRPGEDTRSVLAELGVSDAEFEELRAAEVVT